MKEIKAFVISMCPYCAGSKRAYKELIQEDSKYQYVEIQWINEAQHPEIAEKYDYYYCPAFFIDDEKAFEAHPGQSYESFKENVNAVMDEALA